MPTNPDERLPRSAMPLGPRSPASQERTRVGLARTGRAAERGVGAAGALGTDFASLRGEGQQGSSMAAHELDDLMIEIPQWDAEVRIPRLPRRRGRVRGPPSPTAEDGHAAAARRTRKHVPRCAARERAPPVLTDPPRPRSTTRDPQDVLEDLSTLFASRETANRPLAEGETIGALKRKRSGSDLCMDAASPEPPTQTPPMAYWNDGKKSRHEQLVFAPRPLGASKGLGTMKGMLRSRGSMDLSAISSDEPRAADRFAAAQASRAVGESFNSWIVDQPAAGSSSTINTVASSGPGSPMPEEDDADASEVKSLGSSPKDGWGWFVNF